MPPLNVAQNMRLDPEKPLHDQRLLKALQSVYRLDCKDVAFMQKIGEFPKPSCEPVGLPVNPKLRRARPVKKQPMPA